jgi:hypothetical protein
MNASKAQLRIQYDRAKRLGWVGHFIAAEKAHTKNYFDAADLMGIGSRETNLDPKWLTKPGDGGHGYGLMQADDRSFPGWIETGEWQHAESGIHKGAEILMMKWRDMEDNAGKKLSVKGHAFVGPHLTGFKAQQAVIASYNCGRWALYCAAMGKDPDTYTTGKDYSSDVMARAAIFRSFLAQDSAASSDSKTSDQGVNSDQSANSSDTPANQDTLPPITSPEPVVVQKEKPSIWAKIIAIFTTVSAIGINLGTLIQQKLQELTPIQIGYLIAVLALAALAIWIYQKAAKGAQVRTLALIEKASDPTKHTVELKK